MEQTDFRAVWRWLEDHTTTGADTVLRHAQTSLRSIAGIEIVQNILPFFESQRPGTFVVYATSPDRSPSLRNSLPCVMTYSQLAWRLEQSWDVENQEAWSMKNWDSYDRDMVVVIDHDNEWGIEYVHMITLLMWRMYCLAEEETTSPPGTRMRVLVLSTRPSMDLRLQKLFSLEQTQSFDLKDFYTELRGEAGKVRMGEDEVSDYLIKEIGRSDLKVHVILCFPPWTRLSDLHCGMKVGLSTDAKGKGIHYDKTDFMDEPHHLRIGPHISGNSLSILRHQFFGFCGCLPPVLPEVPETLQARREMRLADKIIRVATLEQASEPAEWIPDYEEHKMAIWVVSGQFVPMASLSTAFGAVIRNTATACSAEELRAQNLMALRPGKMIIANSPESTTMPPEHRQLDIDHSRMADMICMLGYMATCHIGFDAYKAAHAILTPSHKVDEMIRRLSYQRIVSFSVSNQNLVSAVRLHHSAGYDHRVSKLLQGQVVDEATQRVMATKVLLAAAIVEKSAGDITEADLMKALRQEGFAELASRMPGPLVQEGTFWLRAAIWCFSMPLCRTGEERDSYMRAILHGGDGFVGIPSQDGGQHIFIRISKKMMLGVHAKVNKLAQEAGTGLSFQDMEKVWFHRRLASQERREVHMALLDSFLFDLVGAVVKEGGSITLRLWVSQEEVKPSELVSSLILHASRTSEVRRCGPVTLVFGICPTLYEKEGEIVAHDWIWLPSDAVFDWHQTRHPGERLLEGVCNKFIH